MNEMDLKFNKIVFSSLFLSIENIRIPEKVLDSLD